VGWEPPLKKTSAGFRSLVKLLQVSKAEEGQSDKGGRPGSFPLKKLENLQVKGTMSSPVSKERGISPFFLRRNL